MATTHFDAFFNRSEVESYVSTSGHAHPWNDEVIYLDNGRIKTKPVMPPASYLSAGSVDGTTTTISTMSAMPDFKRRFPFMDTYTIEMVIPGQSGTFQMSNDGAPFLLWGAERKPSFFDAELITANHLTCYNKRDAVPGMQHSGDLNSGQYFMHSVRCQTFTENVYAVAAVAYNSSMTTPRLNKLIDYEAVSPFILMVNHPLKIMYAVPFSLERATIGDSMMIAPLIFHMSRDGLVRWYVPPTCPTDGKVATGEYTDGFKRKMRDVVSNFEPSFRSYQDASSLLVATSRDTAPTTDDAPAAAAPKKDDATLHQIVFVQDGVVPSVCVTDPRLGRLFVHFGTTLQISATFAAKPAAPMVLPILSGEAHGHAALQVGKAATAVDLEISSSAHWQQMVDKCPSVVVCASDSSEWYEGVLQSQLHRVVGLMIVRTSAVLSTESKERQRQLTDLKLCCTRLMAGASVVVVQAPSGTAFFYRGATAILPIVPADARFGDPIDLDATLSLHSARSIPFSIGSFVPQAYNMILSSDGSLTPATEACRFVDCAMEGGVAWENVAAQLSICLSTAETDAFKTELTKRILAIEESETKSARDHTDVLIAELKTAFKDAPPDIDLTLHTAPQREAIVEHKKTIRDIQSVYREALGRVEQICSLRIVSARKIGVQQAQRKMAVAQNVSRATNLTASQLANKLMDTTWGFAVARIDKDAAFDMLKAISSNGMDAYLQGLAKPPMHVVTSETPLFDLPGTLAKRNMAFGVAPNCQMLDADSVEILLEHTQETHLLSSTGKQLTFCLQGVPHLVLPLFNDASALNDADYVDFMNKANDEHVADYRVTLRNMLSNLKARLPIKPSSPDLTFGIQMIVLSLMYSITKTISNVAALDPACAVCQTLRSLFYLWGTFAGSGQKPVTFAYQLSQPGAKLALPQKRGEWTIYAIVAHVYPYLRISTDAFKSNVRTLLVRAISHTIVAPLLTESKKKSAAEVAIERKMHINNRNEALRWNYAACAVLTRIDKKSLTPLDGVASASKLLGVVPVAPTFTTRQLTKTLTLIVQGQPIHWDLVRSFVACAVVKRSGFFAGHKKKMTVAALTRAKVSLCHQVNLKLPGEIVVREDRESAPSDLLFCGKMTDEKGHAQYIFKDPSKKTDLMVQNEEAYIKQDSSKMKGDAELTREAWRINGGDELADGLSNSDFLCTMLPTIVDKVSASAAKTLIVSKEIPECCTKDKTLMNLWETADALHPSLLEQMMPAACLRTLFAAINVSDVDQPKAIGDIIHTLLKEKNHEKETMAISHLKATYDMPVATQAPVEIE